MVVTMSLSFGYASEIEQPNVKPLSEQQEQEVAVAGCRDTFGSALTYGYSQGLTADQAWAYADVAYRFCEAGITAKNFGKIFG